jgi:putative heme-binding domain-containing protein
MRWRALAFGALGLLAGLGLRVDAASRDPWTSNHVIGSPLPPPPYTVRRLFPTVRFEHPVDLALVPGTDRLMVAEESGVLWSFALQAASPKPERALELRKHHRPLENVLGFTFHPGFATNRYLFVNYNEPGGRTNGAFVSRFTVTQLDPPTIDPTTERVIIRWLSGGHNGCTLVFGNDGFLYISAGDAANPDPPDMPYRTGQDISDLLASILRIDVDHPSGTNAYAIPPDNPFIGRPSARPEVWAFGLRNPFRMSVDRQTGDLWVGDVGWEQWEMIYRVRRGGNYGWPLVEGPNRNVRTDVLPGPGPILPPMVAISHVDGASITGGHVYRGRRLPRLTGAYLYGDWETGKFWALRHRGDELLSNEELCDTMLKPVSFTLDRTGELLILDYNGGLYELATNQAASINIAFPRRLRDTGLFASMAPLQPASGVVPYQIRAPMWNDHATAEWLLAIPGDGSIATAGGPGNIAGPTWYFPSNTVLARTLTLAMTQGLPSSRRRIETQLLHWDGQAWNPYTYQWNGEQTDALLMPPGGSNVSYTVQDAAAPGGRCETGWRFASRAECLRCHNAWAGEALTLNALQLGVPRRPSPNDPPSEFARLQSLGLLQGASTPKAEADLVNPYDSGAPLAHRARSWLHANCATCHRFGAGGTAAIHLNLEKATDEMRAVSAKPLRGDFDLSAAKIIAPGAPFQSTLLYRISTEGAGHMPLLGSRLVDESGRRLVRDWVASMGSSSPTSAPLPGVGASAVPDSSNEALRPALATMESSLALLDRATAPSSTSAFQAAVAAAAREHTNALVRDLFQRLLPPDQRRVTLGTDFPPGTVLGLSGSAERGRQLFRGTAQCVRCHRAENTGRAFGPALDGLGRKYTRAQLLEQVVYPSKVIAPEFKLVVVTLRNDETELSGFIVRRTTEALTFLDETGSERNLALSHVKETRESTLSAMPEGLLATLTAQEAADLLEYLFTAPPASNTVQRTSTPP